MIKKNIIKVSAILMVLSSLSFAAATTKTQDLTTNNTITQTKGPSEENKKLYNQIFSKYEDKFNKLDVSLLEKKQELKKELREENVNWKKVETITKEKANFKAQKELLSYQLNDELAKNNLRPMRMANDKHGRKDGNRPMNMEEKGFAPKK